MGRYASLTQPRPTPAFDALRALVPEGTDTIRVRAQPPFPKHKGVWLRAELLGAYHWPEYPEQNLVPVEPDNGRPYPDDSPHTSMTLCEFLSTHEYSGAVTLERANETAYTFRIRLTRPRWSDWGN